MTKQLLSAFEARVMHELGEARRTGLAQVLRTHTRIERTNPVLNVTAQGLDVDESTWTCWTEYSHGLQLIFTGSSEKMGLVSKRHVPTSRNLGVRAPVGPHDLSAPTLADHINHFRVVGNNGLRRLNNADDVRNASTPITSDFMIEEAVVAQIYFHRQAGHIDTVQNLNRTLAYLEFPATNLKAEVPVQPETESVLEITWLPAGSSHDLWSSPPKPAQGPGAAGYYLP